MNIALIGCGRIGFKLENDPLRNKPCTHYGGVKAAGLKINYACDYDKERLNEFSIISKINKENSFTDYNKLFNTIKLDLAIIATWTTTHSEIAIAASNAGVKAIVLEKPIAANLSEASEIINICKKNNTKLIINHERRFDNRYKKVQELLKENTIGEIRSVNGQMLTRGYRGNSNIKEGGGSLLHDGTHLIDILHFLFGKIKSVSGSFERYNGRQNGYEDKATAWLKSESDIDIFIEAGGERKYFVFELSISGTLGKIVIGNGYEHLYMATESKFYKGFFDLQEIDFPKYKKNSYFKDLYSHINDVISEKKKNNISTGDDGYSALEIIHTIYLSHSKKGKKIKIPVKPKKIKLKKIFSL